jgi:hypothetical protein
MTLTETVRRLLMDSPGEPVCESCLAFACASSLVDIRPIIETLVTTSSFQRRDHCDGCHRAVPAVVYSGKCAHCSGTIEPTDAVVVIAGDTFHTSCRRLLTSEEAIRASRLLTQQSRRLIDDARREIGKKRATSHTADPASIDADIVRRILSDAAGDPLCELCVSDVANLSLNTARVVITSLLNRGDEFSRALTCAGCRRSVASIVYRAKCAHCGLSLPNGDKGFRMGEELFHRACIHKLIGDDSIPLSRALGRRARRLIEESRRRVRRGYEGPPLESP